jgi:hypothetical protein
MKSRTPPKPAALQRINSLLSSLGNQQRKVLLAGLIAFFLLLGMTTLLLAYYIYEPEITTLLQKPTPLLFTTPTPACAGSTLQIGDTTLQYKTTWLSSDGSTNIPVINPAPAYRIGSSEDNYLFALSRTHDNVNLFNSLKGGEEAIITFDNCNSATFVLSVPQSGTPSNEMLLDQSTTWIIIYIPASGSSTGSTVRGELVGETITAPATAVPNASEIDAEITLLDTSTSSDDTTIQVSISILNYGSAPITFSGSDVSLTPKDAAPLALLQSDPSLPQELKPGVSKTFTLDFPRPSTATATLKIFTIEFDLEDY